MINLPVQHHTVSTQLVSRVHLAAKEADILLGSWWKIKQSLKKSGLTFVQINNSKAE